MMAWCPTSILWVTQAARQESVSSDNDYSEEQYQMEKQQLQQQQQQRSAPRSSGGGGGNAESEEEKKEKRWGRLATPQPSFIVLMASPETSPCLASCLARQGDLSKSSRCCSQAVDAQC